MDPKITGSLISHKETPILLGEPTSAAHAAEFPVDCKSRQRTRTTTRCGDGSATFIGATYLYTTPPRGLRKSKEES